MRGSFAAALVNSVRLKGVWPWAAMFVIPVGVKSHEGAGMAQAKARRGLGALMLDGIEWAGNKLPDPVTLFVIAIGTVIGLSVHYSSMGLTVMHHGTGKEVAAVSLLDAEQVRDCAFPSAYIA